MSVSPVAHPAPQAAVPKPEPVNADGSAIPDEILDHHRPEDIGDLTNQDVPDDSESESTFFGEDGLTFGDILDVINPLQHIPIVSTIYRAITGDEISPGARVAGGALYGGPIGFAAATANALVEAATGDDIGDPVMAALFNEEDDTVPEGLAAAATGASPTVAAAPAAPAQGVAVAQADPAIVGIAAQPLSLLPQTRAQSPVLPAAAAPQTAKLPFGGIGTLPTPREQTDDPMAALLQARAAVPQAGPVPGLGNAARPRPVQQAPLPSISPLLADKLSALAAQSSRSVANTERTEDAGSAAAFSQVVGPQQMLETLDRYQRMKAGADRTS